MAAPTGPGELVNQLRTSSSCRNCHTFDNLPGDEVEPSYAPITSYGGSMMANAARDPVFWAGVALASQDDPEQTSLCIRCHAPKAFIEGRGESIALDELTDDDREGIVCELCHRMVDEGNIGNAQYTVDDVLGPFGNVPRRAAWTYVPGDEPPHGWMVDAFIGTSELCGTCHDVTTARERLDDDGMGMGMLFNEQRTYSEWANSDFAAAGPRMRSCQDCHLPAVSDVVGCGTWDPAMAHETGRRHDLVGANRFMVQLMQTLYGSAGSDEVEDEQFDHTLAQMDELLHSAATLHIDAAATVDLREGLDEVSVTVTNLTGHKLPTGYAEGRQMWLELTAWYGEQLVYSSGLYEPGVGPEHDEQLRTYQGIAEEYRTGVEGHLLLNDHWVEDTRIPPAGLWPDIQTDPVGDRYSLLEDGTWPNFDVVPYGFGATEVQDTTPQDATDDELQVFVRLLYVINTPEYIDLLADDNVTNEAGVELAGLFDAMGGAAPIVLAEADVVIPIVGFFEPAGASSSGSTTTATSTMATSMSVDDTTGLVSVSLSGAASFGTSTGMVGSATDEPIGGCKCQGGPASGRAWPLWSVLLLLFGRTPFGRRRRR